MDRTKDEGPLVCMQMPEAAALVTSERFMPKVSEETRARVRDAILRIDGSSQDEGMTCIAKKDLPMLTEKVLEGMQKGSLEDRWNFGYRDHLQGFMRNLNRHCDECSSVCADRVRYSRAQLKRISEKGAYTNSRRSKVKLPEFDFDEAIA